MHDDNNKYNKTNSTLQTYEIKTNDFTSPTNSIHLIEISNAMPEKGINSGKLGGNVNRIFVNPQFSETKQPISTNTTPEHNTFGATFIMKDSKTLISILKKGGRANQLHRDLLQKRLDSNGIQIFKGGKKHKILFKEKLHEVKIVENWKEYNMENYAQTTCHCSIF